MDETVLLGHGSGGSMMKRIIDQVFFEAYGGEELLEGNDAASLPLPTSGERLAFSTDSFDQSSSGIFVSNCGQTLSFNSFDTFLQMPAIKLCVCSRAFQALLNRSGRSVPFIASVK